MTSEATAQSGDANATVRRISRDVNSNWLGVAPFFLFAFLFLIGPVLYLVAGAFQSADGAFTFDNIIALGSPNIVASFWLSIRLSLVSALMGAVAGLLLGQAVILGGLPNWVRNAFTTFSGVASNFAGVPLAFAFIATLGRLGLVTVLLRDLFGINLYASGFNLFSFFGVSLVYLYFQLPLMFLIIAPALDGLKGMARGSGDPWGQRPPVLANGRPADPDADHSGLFPSAVCQRLRHAGHCLCADGIRL